MQSRSRVLWADTLSGCHWFFNFASGGVA